MAKTFTTLVCLCVVSIVVKADILFPKDTSTDFVFPPKSRRSSTGLPDGHLRPLGWQRIPEGKVSEVTIVPDPKTFWETNVKEKKPLVIREGINKTSDCFKLWDDKYLKTTFGQINVEVTTKKPGKIIHPHVMTFKRFLLRYNLEDWYLISPVPDQMLPDVPAVSCLLCGSFRKHAQEAEMWMSSGGTSSNLHYDPDHNLHCLLSGRKDIILIDPKFKDRLEMEVDKDLGSGFSRIDAEMVNMFEHPKVGKTSWRWTTLWPGDCVFIPAGHLHQVRSYGRSLSITTLWTPTREFNDTGCADTDIKEHVPLSDIDFVWKLYDGERLINTDNYDDPEVLRHHLLCLLRDETRLPRERFFRYWEKARNDISRKKNQTPHAAFRQLDLKKKNYITLKDILKLPKQVLKRTAEIYTRPKPEDDLFKDEL